MSQHIASQSNHAPPLLRHNSHIRPPQNDPIKPTKDHQSESVAEDALVSAMAAVQDEPPDEDDELNTVFEQMWRNTEGKIDALFLGRNNGKKTELDEGSRDSEYAADHTLDKDVTSEPAPPKKPIRTIDDDYDDDEEEDEIDNVAVKSSVNTATHLPSPSKSGSSPVPSDIYTAKPATDKDESSAQPQPQNVEELRKQLGEAKKATEDAVRRSFSTMMYTLENDRIAMLEQQKLEESEKQIDADLDHNGNAVAGTVTGEVHGTLSQTNLGSSSLKFKHLIERIDRKRHRMQASSIEIQNLLGAVRKNRSKWASEEQVGQEELYESAEKVLVELKALTEYSTPFLTRVNKREAPDYYSVIKTPMDLGTMTKKLKTLAYTSTAEFVADLELIWTNCLKYNGDMSHPLRRSAIAMRKAAEKLIPLIPDIVIRSRAEVEAEERRKQHGADDADESDEEPIMSSRGRKAPSKSTVKGTKASKTVPESTKEEPQAEKPELQLNGASHHDADSQEHASNGNVTPTIGRSGTPNEPIHNHGDAMEIDGASLNGTALQQAFTVANDDIQEDEETKVWKQFTKKDRALVAKERHKLFKGDKLNADEPALLRNKAGMRRWLRQYKQAELDRLGDDQHGAEIKAERASTQAETTLAEGMEGEEERALPEYYDSLAAIPEIEDHMRWIEDDKGQLVDFTPEESLRMAPKGHFTAPQGQLTSRIDANMRQMQETRKVCSKIGVVKQMQLQSQMYNNQFSKYAPEPFVEADIEGHVTTDEGPIMANWVCKAALQRSVGKLCYYAGFEELQPTALDVITDLAADYFHKIASTFQHYREVPKVRATGLAAESGIRWQPRYTNEEVLLHALAENGTDVESLESYARDENEKLGVKLVGVHERMKANLRDLLRPALANDAGADGVDAFKDGSEQFVGGDFAEDLEEDFFGFKELGLDVEFGISSMSVPLHLLQSKLSNAHQANNAISSTDAKSAFEDLPRLENVTPALLIEQPPYIQDFFNAKLALKNTNMLIEDDDLPLKQRFPKPRLPPNGKITSPRKRPLKEQQGNAKKKKKLENGTAAEISPAKSKRAGDSISPEKAATAAKKTKMEKVKALSFGVGRKEGLGGIEMERGGSQASLGTEGEGKEEVRRGSGGEGMMSPESIVGV